MESSNLAVLRDISELLSGYSWGGGNVTISYSFPSALPNYYSVNEIPFAAALTSAQQAAVRQVFDEISAFTNITFVEETDPGEVGDITLAFREGLTTTNGHAYWEDLGQSGKPGDVWFNNKYVNDIDVGPGSPFYTTAMHEIAHAIGVKHATLQDLADFVPYLSPDGVWPFTIMGDNEVLAAQVTVGAFPSSFLVYDIAVLQHIYGVGTANTGSDLYDSWGVYDVKTIYDTSGIDTISVAEMVAPATIDLRMGALSSIVGEDDWAPSFGSVNNISIAIGSYIENAIGTGLGDLLIGNEIDNLIQGGQGNDFIYGDGAIDDSKDAQQLVSINNLLSELSYRYVPVLDANDLPPSGNDILEGGAGDDYLAGGSGDDVLAGGTENDLAIGGNGNDTIDGGAGEDVLYGDYYSVAVPNNIGSDDSISGGAGNDQIYGGSGDDIVYADYRPEETPNGPDGNDLIYGDDGNDAIHGGGGNDTIYGGDDNDVISGGAGVDTLYGGNGNNKFVFAYGDTIVWNGINESDADVIMDATSGDKIFFEGVQLTGGKDWARVSQYYYDHGVGPILLSDLYYQFFENEVNWDGYHESNPDPSGSMDEAKYADGYGNQYYAAADGNLYIYVAVDSDNNPETEPESSLIVVNNWINGDLGITLQGAGHIRYGYYENEDDAPPPPPGLQVGGNILAPFHEAAGMVSPLVLDLAGDGVASVSKENSHAYFDLDNDQFAERTGWVGKDDAFLAIDVNGNGYIDNITELFGNATTNGFSALGLLDSNKDSIIDSLDTDYGKLRLWTDYNQNGVNDGGELRSLAGAGIVSISLSTTSVNSTVNGNLISDFASFTRADKSTDDIVDIWFSNDQIDTRYIGPSGMHVPTAHSNIDQRGFGEIMDLRQAMALDATIDAEATVIETFSAASLSEWLTEAIDVIYAWGDVDSVAYNARGANIDARHVAFLEKLVAQDFIGSGGANPTAGEAADLEQAWNAFAAISAGQLLTKLASTGFSYDLPGGVYRDFTGASVLSEWATIAANSINGADLAWIFALKQIDAAELDPLENPVTFEANLATKISQSGLTQSVAELRATDLHIGSTTADFLLGSDDNDYFIGGAGNDTMSGGKGNDTYEIDNLSDVIVDGSSQGTDLVKSSITYTLSTHLENLTLVGTAAINGNGNASVNKLVGNDNDNVLDGKGGADTMAGGKGDDYYYVEDAGDVVTEASNAGTDTIQAALTWMLGSNIENLVLFGASAVGGTGNTLNNTLNGNSLANSLSGLDGNDILNGADGNDTLTGGNGNDTLNGNAGVDSLNGGSGNDILDGGTGGDSLTGSTGNDTYYVDNAGDTVTETSGQGTDSVISTVNYTLTGNVENLTLAGAVAISATGNTLANIIVGNDLDNIIDGGSAADKLTGGLGNDYYYVDNASDQVTELSGQGTDTIQGSISWALGDHIENLVLFGASALNGTGNAFNNKLTGNSLNNLLTGNDGDDILEGGDGNDSLVGGLGNDELYGGTGHDSLDGGDGNDLLVGATGNDLFIGGAGDDQMTGAGGVDRFDYNVVADRGTGGDTINDFTKGLGGDILDLADLLDSVGYAGSTPFDGADGYIRFSNGGGNTVVELDQDGGGNSYVTLVTLTGVTLTQSDTANYVV